MGDVEKKRACVCFFGVIGRSIRFTYDSITKQLIDPLKKEFDVDIYVFNLDVENSIVDGRSVNCLNYKIIKSDYCESRKQSDLDKEIDIYYQSGICKMRHDYTKVQIINAVRQMYSEYRVGKFLEEHRGDYDTAIVCGPDYYLLNEISMYDVRKSVIQENTIYTTSVNDGQGYTNGFYIGNLNSLINVLKRYEIITELLPTKYDYEYLLKQSFIKYDIVRNITDLLFVKVRNNQSISRQGKMRYPVYRKLINTVKLKRVLDPEKQFVTVIPSDIQEKPTTTRVNTNVIKQNPVEVLSQEVSQELIAETAYEETPMNEVRTRASRGCALTTSKTSSSQNRISLKPQSNTNPTRNPDNKNDNRYRRVSQQVVRQPAAQPTIEPLQSSNRNKRKQQPATKYSNKLHAQLRLMKITK